MALKGGLPPDCGRPIANDKPMAAGQAALAEN
jgi:hypothetical protein